MGDRLKAFGTGAGQSITGGWQDEAVAKLLSMMPTGDAPGTPAREYSAGSEYKDLRDNARSENSMLAERYPKNYTAGSLVGAAPAAGATLAMGGIPAVVAGVAQGAVQGAGSSTNTGKELAKDAVRGGAVGGALGAAGNAVSAAAPALKQLWKQGPPQGPQPVPALAGTNAGTSAPVRAPVPGKRPQINMSESVSSMPAARPSVPPASLEAAEVEARAALRRAEAMDELRKRPFRPDSGPLDKVPSKIPDLEDSATEARMHVREEDGEKFFVPQKAGKEPVKAAEQTESSVAKTVPPKKKARAPKPPLEQTGLAVRSQEPSSEQMAQLQQIAERVGPKTSVDRPLMSPQQLPDERVLELARQQREAAPAQGSGLVPWSADKMADAKQALAQEFKKTASGGNVVDLGDGAIQAVDDPFIAGRVREYQQHAKSAQEAGDADTAQWYQEKIEELLGASE